MLMAENPEVTGEKYAIGSIPDLTCVAFFLKYTYYYRRM